MNLEEYELLQEKTIKELQKGTTFLPGDLSSGNLIII